MKNNEDDEKPYVFEIQNKEFYSKTCYLTFIELFRPTDLYKSRRVKEIRCHLTRMIFKK